MLRTIQHFLFLAHEWAYSENNTRICTICGITEFLQWTEEEKWDWVPGAIAWLSNDN
jgi:hypothetical protein